MAKKEISIVIRARNALIGGIASAKKSLMAFGGFVAGIGSKIAYGLMAGGGALVGLEGLALKAYAGAEKSEMALASALSVHGDAVDDILPKLKKIAKAIQEETGVEDDATVAGMATMRMLGVQADELEGAARAAIALKSANIDGESAFKAVAMAVSGNYRMLSRIIPAIRNATSEAEKARIVNDFLTSGYQQQKAMLGTTSGAWGLLKTQIGDVLENIGEGINKNDGIARALRRAAGAAKEFGERIKTYIDSERFKKMQESIEGVVSSMLGSKDDRGQAMAKMGESIRASFALAALEAVVILKKAAAEIGSLIASGVKSGTKKFGWVAAITAMNPAVKLPKLGWKFWSSLFGSKPVKSLAVQQDSPEMKAAKERLANANADLASYGLAAYQSAQANKPPSIEPPIDQIDVAGTGAPVVDVAEEAGKTLSTMMENMLGKLRNMGHDVEQFGTSSLTGNMQKTAQEQMDRDRQADLLESSISVQEETRDLLRENLKAP